MNTWIGIGRLTRDPKLNITSSGLSVCNFTIAIERQFKNAAGDKETDFINCVVWRKTAENLAQYQKKGSLIAVDGSLQMRKYEKDGENRTLYEIMVEKIQFLGSTKQDGFTGAGDVDQGNSDPIPPSNHVENDDDLPF